MSSRSRTLPSAARFELADLSLDESVPFAVRRAYRTARLLFPPQEVEYALDRLAVQLTVEWQQLNPLCMALVPRGLVFAGMLLQRMVFPLQFISVAQDETPALDAVAGRAVLLIDAEVDRAVHGPLSERLLAAGASGVDPVVLLAPADAIEGYRYVGLNSPCQRLLGCGFALDGYGGNLPGIYTYPETA